MINVDTKIMNYKENFLVYLYSTYQTRNGSPMVDSSVIYSLQNIYHISHLGNKY